MNNSESIIPTPEGAAIVAALAAMYKDIPLTDEELGWIYTEPKEAWLEGLADKVEALLNQNPV